MELHEAVNKLLEGDDVSGVSVQQVYERMASYENSVKAMIEQIHEGGDWMNVAGYFEERAIELLEEHAESELEKKMMSEAGYNG